MIKENFTPKTDIKEYLTMDDDFISSIYNDVKTNPIYMKILPPLDFLNLLYEQLEIIDLNIDNPLSLSNHLFNLNLNKNKELNSYMLLIFLKYLIAISIGKKTFSMQEKYIEEGLPMFYFYITELIESKIELSNPKAPLDKPDPNKILFKFATIKNELRYFQNKTEKINYLIEVKTNFLQKNPDIKYSVQTPLMDSDFAEKCDLEIQRLNSLIEIEQEKEVSNKQPEKELEKVKIKLGRKNVEPKPLNKYFHSLEKERIPVFIKVLKKEFKNSDNKEFVYMIKALKELNCISYNTNTEIYQAFEKEFGEKYGSETAKNNQMINIDKAFQKIIIDKIIRIKQSNNIY